MKKRIGLLCDQKRPATLTTGSPPGIFRTRFRRVSHGLRSVVFEFLELNESVSIHEGDSCTVIFGDGPRTSVFVSFVESFDAFAAPLPTLQVKMPEQIERTEGRGSLRIPLLTDTPLQVWVEYESWRWSPRPIDISIGGLLVEDSGDSAPALKEEVSVIVEMELLENRARLEGLLQHRWGGFYAIYFAEVLRELRHGNPSVPVEMRPILDYLEQDWLERLGQQQL